MPVRVWWLNQPSCHFQLRNSSPSQSRPSQSYTSLIYYFSSLRILLVCIFYLLMSTGFAPLALWGCLFIHSSHFNPHVVGPAPEDQRLLVFIFQHWLLWRNSCSWHPSIHRRGVPSVATIRSQCGHYQPLVSLLHILVTSGFNDFGPCSYYPTILVPARRCTTSHWNYSPYICRTLSVVNIRGTCVVRRRERTTLYPWRFLYFHHLILLRWFPDGYRIPWPFQQPIIRTVLITFDISDCST